MGLDVTGQARSRRLAASAALTAGVAIGRRRDRTGSRRRPRRTPCRPARRPRSRARSSASIAGRRDARRERVCGASHSVGEAPCRPPAQSPCSSASRMPTAASRMASNAAHDLRVAVDVPLHHVPVVDARLARRARVREDDPALEIVGVDGESATRRTPARPSLDGGDAAVERRPVVLDARRHADHLRLDVHREARAGHRRIEVAPGPRGQRRRRWRRSAPTTRRCRRRPASPTRRAHVHAARAEVVHQSSRRAAGRRSAATRGPRLRAARPCRPMSATTRAVRSRRQRAVRAQADGGVDRLRAVVKEIQRPDVEGAAREIDAGRRGRDDAHARIIMARTNVGSRASPPRRPAGHRRIRRSQRARRAPPARRRVRSRRRHLLRPQHRRAAAGRRAVARGVVARRRLAALGQRGPGGRPRRAPEAAVHRMAADDHARAERRRRAGRAICARARRRAAAVGITLDYAPVLDVHTNPANPGHRRSRAGRARRRWSRGWARRRFARCRGRASPPAASTFPGHGDTSTDSHDELPVVEHDRDRLEAVELVPFRAAIAERRRDAS